MRNYYSNRFDVENCQKKLSGFMAWWLFRTKFEHNLGLLGSLLFSYHKLLLKFIHDILKYAINSLISKQETIQSLSGFHGMLFITPSSHLYAN